MFDGGDSPEITQSPHEIAESSRMKVARETVEGMDPDIKEDLRPYAQLEKMIHTGADLRGRRLSPDERRIFQKNLEVYKRKLIDKYAKGDSLRYNDFARSQGLGFKEVIEVLAEEEPEKVAA